LHDIVEGHGLDGGLLLKAGHQETKRLSAREDEVQRIVVTHLHKGEPLLQPCQSQLVPGVDRCRGVSVLACVYDGAEAIDAVLAANDVERRHSCSFRIHVFVRDFEVGAGLRCKLHQQGGGYEARTLIVDANSLKGRIWQYPQVDYGESTCS